MGFLLNISLLSPDIYSYIQLCLLCVLLYPEAIVNVVLHCICFISNTSSLFFISKAKTLY